MSADRPLRLAVVGCGAIATQHHGPAIADYVATHPGLELVACCDVDAGRADSFARAFGFAAAETAVGDLLDRHRPDAVMAFVPERFGAAVACQVAARRIPLLMEKPPGASLEDYRRIVAAADAAGSVVQVAFNRRTMPLVARLERELEPLRAAGGLQHLACDFIRSGRDEADFAQTLIHAIDVVGFLAGRPWSAVELRYQEPAAGPASGIHLFGRFAGGATAAITCCPLAGTVVERLAVHARDHTLLAELPIWGSLDVPGRLRHLHRQQCVLDCAGAADDPPHVAWGFAAEDAAFLDGLLGRGPGCTDVRAAAQAMAIAEAIRRRQPGIAFPAAAAGQG